MLPASSGREGDSEGHPFRGNVKSGATSQKALDALQNLTRTSSSPLPSFVPMAGVDEDLLDFKREASEKLGKTMKADGAEEVPNVRLGRGIPAALKPGAPVLCEIHVFVDSEETAMHLRRELPTTWRMPRHNVVASIVVESKHEREERRGAVRRSFQPGVPIEAPKLKNNASRASPSKVRQRAASSQVSKAPILMSPDVERWNRRSERSNASAGVSAVVPPRLNGSRSSPER